MRSLRRVVQVGQAGVVELQVAAAGSASRRTCSRRRRTGPTRTLRGRGRRRDRSRPGRLGSAPCWATGSSASASIRQRSTAGSRSRHRRSFRPAGSSPSTRSAAGANSMVPGRVTELDRQVPGGLGDAAEPVDEVHVPRGTAELAVGCRPQPGLLLLPHRRGIASSSTARRSVAVIRPAAKSPAAPAVSPGAAGCRRGRHGTEGGRERSRFPSYHDRPSPVVSKPGPGHSLVDQPVMANGQVRRFRLARGGARVRRRGWLVPEPAPTGPLRPEQRSRRSSTCGPRSALRPAVSRRTSRSTGAMPLKFRGWPTFGGSVHRYCPVAKALSSPSPGA